MDRDDTIIQNSGDLGDPDEVRLIADAAAAIKQLQEAGYRIIVITNQGGVARGKYSEDDVDAVNQRIAHLITEESGALIDRFYYCPFHPNGSVTQYACEHPWRKPQPGMLLQAADDLDLDLAQCWMVGDQERDIEAGIAAGCRTVLVRTGQPEQAGVTKADLLVATLTEAASAITGGGEGPPETDRNDVDSHTPGSDDTTVEAAGPDDQVITRLTDLHTELRAMRAAGSEFTAGRLLTMIALILVLGLAVGCALYMEPQSAVVWVVVAGVGELALIGLVLLLGRQR
ncbi:MAG: HAD family hydrolase [Planctomycetes bacterium]|nr:HAD family hydrolase [Planctomycetota bacterium]